jgi:predicted RNase H-like nuclease (RuvC/YqgF family)
MEGMKSNQKCVRLSDRVLKYIDGYRGENFSQKLENYVLDVEERREQLTLDWERLNAQIHDQRQELERLRSRIRRTAEVDRRFAALVSAVMELVDG